LILSVLAIGKCLSLSAERFRAAASPLGLNFCSAVGFAWLFKVLTATHLSLEATPLDNLAESSDRFLNRLSFSHH
jgi:hypothetical protein